MRLLLGWWLDLSALIDRVELPSPDGVRQDFGSFLDALEKLIALVATGGGLLIGMMLENLLAVGALDLVLGGTVSQTGYAENSVVILRLRHR